MAAERLRSQSAADSEANLPSSSGDDASASWNTITDRLVALSAIPLAVVVLPQVFQNFVNMTSGNSAALSIISWEGYTSGLFGNALMCTHFASSGENSAVKVQLIGMFNGLLVLTQVALAKAMPMPVFLSVLALAAIAATVNCFKVSGVIKEGASLWRSWQMAAGVVGLSFLPQVAYNMTSPVEPSIAPALIAFGVVSAALALRVQQQKSKSNRLPPADQRHDPFIEQIPGWAATLLFGLSPLPQLLRNFTDASALEGLSLATMILALIGNGLMAPRALFTGDPVWMVGSAWACTATWISILSLWLGKSTSTGQPFVDTGVFALVTVVYVAYVSWVFITDRKVKQQKSKMSQ